MKLNKYLYLIVVLSFFSQVSYGKSGDVLKQFDSARNMVVNGKTSMAIDVLRRIIKDAKKSGTIDLNQVYLTLGRAYYQISSFDKAIESYNKVDKDSDFWLESIEEKAWSYASLSKEEEALAQLSTLMTPLFDQVIGPEPYFLKALSQLRICDYYGVLKTTHHFKTRYIERVEKLQTLVKQQGFIKETDELIRVSLEGRSVTDLLTKKLVSFPYMFHRDKFLQSYFSQLKKLRKKGSLVKKINERLVYLAKSNLKEIEKYIQLIQVVEAEVIQRVHIATSPDDTYKNDISKKGSEWLNFPVSDEEVWVDEIDKFKVQIKTCPNKKEIKKWAAK